MADHQPPRRATFQIPTHLPVFVEDKDNTAYANFINVVFNESDCCLTFMRKPRPLSVDLEAVKAGNAKLEMLPLSRVYLSHDVARSLCQVLTQHVLAVDEAKKAKPSSPN